MHKQLKQSNPKLAANLGIIINDVFLTHCLKKEFQLQEQDLKLNQCTCFLNASI